MKYDEKYFETSISAYGHHGGYSQMKTQIQSLYFGCIKRLRCFDLDRGNGKRALDVGCGYGYLCEILESFGYEIYGIDVSKHALSKARTLLGSNAVLIAHDAQKPLPFRPKFNLITCFELLEHLERPELAIQNCYNSLKAGGIFVASTPNRFSLYTLYLRDVTHVNVKSIWDWKKLFLKQSWSSLKIFSFQWLPLIWRISRKRLLENLILEIPLVGYMLFIVARKPPSKVNLQ